MESQAPGAVGGTVRTCASGNGIRAATCGSVDVGLRPFQRRFVRSAFAPGIRTAALTLPRGNGKSTLAGYLAARALTPGDPIYVAGAESVLIGGSIEQCRIVFRAARRILEPTGEYRFLDSATRCAITHKASNTRLRVVGSNAKTTMGLVDCPLAILDEPGVYETVAGGLMWDAVRTAQGKPGSPLRAVLVGTIAPAAAGWWPDLIAAGTHGSTHVMALQGDAKTWDQWATIRRCNPLMARFPESRATLLEERDKARGDSRLRAAFCSYRLNLPTADESTTLITVADWQRVTARPVSEPAGRPVVGVDLGAGRSWSAAVALWPNGRTEALAIAPGVPSVEAQEKRDRVPAGTYARLVESSRLTLAAGLRVPSPAALVERIAPWRPVGVWCDRFRLPEMLDATGGRFPVHPRVSRWSDAAFDVRALRKAAADGPLAVETSSRPLLAASLAAATVRNDDQGNVRLVKRDAGNNTGRDDVAAALVLAAGALARRPARRKARLHVA